LDRKLLVLILLPITILMVIVPAQIIPKVGAAPLPPMVCTAQPIDLYCRAPAPVFNGPVITPSVLLRVPIVINNTDTINGFDITLKVSDVSKLKPYDADLIGTVMPTNVILAKCIGGILIQGSTCASATDTPDTIHLSVIDTGNPLPVGTTGLLFTAVFNITGTTSTGGITIGYQTGCPNSSVSGTTVCVSMPNGTTAPTPETTQDGGFDNSNVATLPYATMTSAKNNLGQFLFGLAASTTDALTLNAVNGFDTTSTPFVTITSTVTGKNPVPTSSLSPPFIDFSNPPATSATSTLTASVATTSAKGNDTVTITGMYTTQDPNTLTTSSLEAIAILPLTVVDFSITANPGTISNTVTSNSAQTSISILPTYFVGLVKLGVQASSLPIGVTASYSSATITSPTTSTLTITVSGNTPSGAYTITLTANSTLNGVTKLHTGTLTLQVQGHSVTIDSVTVSPQGPVAIGTKVTLTVQVDNKGSFAETVTVNALINNVTVATASNVMVAANTVVPVTLTWTTTAAGTFTLSANVLLPAGETNTLTNSSKVGDYTVQPAATSPFSDSTVLALIAVIIAVAVIAGFILIRRRRTSTTPTPI